MDVNNDELMDNRHAKWKLEDNVNLICSLTDYPYELVKDVLLTNRLIELEQFADIMQDSDTLPDETKFVIPLYGTINIEKAFEGRNGGLIYGFTPTVKFDKLLKNAFYYGTTPMLDLYKKNFDKSIKWRYDNLVHDEEMSKFE